MGQGELLGLTPFRLPADRWRVTLGNRVIRHRRRSPPPFRTDATDAKERFHEQ
jgi:hypothetical protein